MNKWYYGNKDTLHYLFEYLIDLSKQYGIILKENNESFNYFIEMMYYESNKMIIKNQLFFSEFCKQNDEMDIYKIY